MTWMEWYWLTECLQGQLWQQLNKFSEIKLYTLKFTPKNLTCLQLEFSSCKIMWGPTRMAMYMILWGSVSVKYFLPFHFDCLQSWRYQCMAKWPKLSYQQYKLVEIHATITKSVWRQWPGRMVITLKDCEVKLFCYNLYFCNKREMYIIFGMTYVHAFQLLYHDKQYYW
jgi:hypothetical protein